MNILLDTCTFLWMLDDVARLGKSVRPLLEDASNRLVLHQASSWEIQIKHDLGKLGLSRSPEEIVREGVERAGIEYRTLRDEEIWHLQKLPLLHGDPFDRILIACAQCDGLKLATPDPNIARYPLPVVW